jgi:hypothetical protein
MRACLVAAVVLTACSDDPEWVIKVGLIQMTPDVPSPVIAGQPFVVRITTGGNSCVEPERTDVEQTSYGALVIPYDRHQVPDGFACLQLLQYFQHEATVVFDAPGAQTIRIRGLNRGSRAGVPFEEPVDTDYAVSVE